MDLSSPFITNSQAAKLMKESERSLDDPAVDPQAATVFGIARSESRIDAAPSRHVAMAARTVRAVRKDDHRTRARLADSAGDRWDRMEQREQFGDIMPVRANQCVRQRDTVPGEPLATVDPRANLAHCFRHGRHFNNVDLLIELGYDFPSAVALFQQWLIRYRSRRSKMKNSTPPIPRH